MMQDHSLGAIFWGARKTDGARSRANVLQRSHFGNFRFDG